MKSNLKVHLADCLTKIAVAHKAMMEDCEKGDAAHTAHMDAIESCTKTANECMAGAKADKAAGLADADDALEPLPVGLARVTPTAPPRAIVRPGQPEISKAAVPQQFAHLIQVEGEE
jgi:hypothetical protein